MRIEWIAALIVLLVALPITGCKDTPSVSGVKWEIERQMPGIHLERESHIRLGRFAFGVLKRVVLWAMDEDEDGREIIRHIRRVNFVTYRVRGLPDSEGFEDTYRFEKKLGENGWETLVASATKGSAPGCSTVRRAGRPAISTSSPSTKAS